MSVGYATSDGTATAGSDYTATSGTLTFAAGETSRTVAVTVLDDSVDEQSETFTLTLSNASGGNAYIADATATGTIENDDPMPKAWLARFGRTLAGQVVDAVGSRIEGGRGSHLRVAGMTLNGTGTLLPGTEAAPQRFGIEGLAGDPPLATTRSLSARELLLGSAFSLSTGGEKGGPLWSGWGRVAFDEFDADARRPNGRGRHHRLPRSGCGKRRFGLPEWPCPLSDSGGDFSLVEGETPGRSRTRSPRSTLRGGRA